MKVAAAISVMMCCAIVAIAQSQSADTLQTEKSLDEIVVEGKYIVRDGDKLLITPTKEQRRHASNGYELLRNLMLPGVGVDVTSGAVNVIGMNATLYINGLPCDLRDMKALRPRDVVKIEYIDAPSGRYSNDVLAINFITKQYRYGGYVTLDGYQTVGINSGSYNVASSINNDKLTYSVFAGFNYHDVKGNEQWGEEHYYLPQGTISRETHSTICQKANIEYGQFRVQYQDSCKQVVGKISLGGNSVPAMESQGTINQNGGLMEYTSHIDSKSISSRFDLTGQFTTRRSHSFTYGLHGAYSRNRYNRVYDEVAFASTTRETENAGNIQASLIYNWIKGHNSLTTSFFQYYNIYDATYEGTTSSRQRLWKSETLGFLAYDRALGSHWSVNGRVGFNWYQFRLHGNDRFSSLHPRLNIGLRYRNKNSMVMLSSMFANPSYGMNVINRATVVVNPYLVVRGNPYLNKSYDTSSYIYYSGQFGKFNIAAMSQYAFDINPVTNVYFTDGNTVVRSYANDGNDHYASAAMTATFNPSNRLALSGYIQCSHTRINTADEHIRHNSLTGNLIVKWYVGEFSISPWVEFGKTTLSRSSAALTCNPISYNLQVTYTHGNLYAAVSFASPFSRNKTASRLATSVYAYKNTIMNRSLSRLCYITLSYTLDFGRRIQKVEKGSVPTSDSSLLQY